MPSTTECFAPLVRTLAATHRVLIADSPGYGATPPLEGTYSFERVQAALDEALIARGVERAVVVGYSGGAYRAFAMAFSSRVRVDAIVSIAGFAGLDPAARDGFRGAAAALRAEGPEAFRAGWLARMAGPGFASRFPKEAIDVMSWLDCAAPTTLANELETIACAKDLRPHLPQMSFPILATTGAEDAAVPRAWSEDIAAAAPNAELRVVAGCGHALLYEDRDGTVGAVRDFVRSVA
jgi:3-oxoadipate enol-lactonase